MGDIHGEIKKLSQSLLHQVKSSKLIMTQCLVNLKLVSIPSSSGQVFQGGHAVQGDSRLAKSQSLLHQVKSSKLIMTQCLVNLKLVSIPSSSGQVFQGSVAVMDTYFNGDFVSQSLLHQVKSSKALNFMQLWLNIWSQSLLHQVKSSKLLRRLL